MEEERRRSQNKDLKATSIMMELVEIEHSIKIAENGPVSIREVHNWSISGHRQSHPDILRLLTSL